MPCLNKKLWKKLSNPIFISFVLSFIVCTLLFLIAISVHSAFAKRPQLPLEENVKNSADYGGAVNAEILTLNIDENDDVHQTAVVKYVDEKEDKVIKTVNGDAENNGLETIAVDDDKIAKEIVEKEKELDEAIEKAENWADDEIVVMNEGELIFETTIQDYLEEDFMYAINEKGIIYLSLSQFANFVGIIYENKDNLITSHYSNKKDFLYLQYV